MDKNDERKNVEVFSANSTNVYIDALPDLIQEYNNTEYSSIKMTPVNASKKKKNNLRFEEIFIPIMPR